MPVPAHNPLVNRLSREDRARRAYDLIVSGYNARQVAEMMTAEGYEGCSSHVTIYALVKDYSKGVLLPSATEYGRYQYERLQRELTKLDGLELHMETILARHHITVSNGKVIYVGDEPLRDDGPEMAAVGKLIDIQRMRVTIEERISRLLGTDAVQKTQVEHINTDETDRALKDLVAEMNGAEVAPTRTDA